MRLLQIFVLVFGLVIVIHAQKAVLSGSVYDANGYVIVDASVIAVDQKNLRYETNTKDDGTYTLSLPINRYDPSDKNFQSHKFRLAKYEISVTARGFEKYYLREFKLVPAFGGKMQLDFALDIGTVCGPIIFSSRPNK